MSSYGLGYELLLCYAAARNVTSNNHLPESAAAQGRLDDIACVLHHAGSYVKDVASGDPVLFTQCENVIYLLFFARTWVRILTMELVTVVRANLKRIGSTQRGGFGGNYKQVTITREVGDEKPESVRQAVIEIAEQHGEQPGALEELKLTSHWGHGLPMMTFNIQQPMMQFSDAYAECEVFPALKVGCRYFKLEELK